MNNPLLKEFDAAPFENITSKDFLPAIKESIEIARKEIESIRSSEADATFANTIEALDYTGNQLDRVTSVFFNLNSAETNDDIQRTAQEVSPLLSEFRNDITLDQKLFERIAKVYDQKEELALSTEQRMLLDKKYKSFARNGARLSQDKKEELRAIDKELSALTLKFGENVLAETNAYELHLTKKEDLTGLPEGAIESAKQLAEERNKPGWIITLDYPSYVPFMKYADNRALRKELSIAFGARAFKENTFDNQENVKKIASLRFSKAQLLGYKTYADFVLEERMAEKPGTVKKFLQNLLAKAKPAAKKEFEKLSAFAKERDQLEQLEKWDGSYYSEKLKQKLFSIDDEALKPYFELESVLNGVFTIVQKLYGLTFKENTTVDVYHDEVQVFDVFDENHTFVALFYTDFHPRAGKRGGAWMTSYKSQMQKDQKEIRPHVSIVCNFTPATPSKPALLGFNEVTTLFHEFGHALHGMLANTTYPSLSGTSVYWDFVELPSQIFENWCYEEEALKLFAKHYKTGEIIPMDLVAKIKAAATFQEGMATLRQVSFGLLDLAWHGTDPTDVSEVKEYEKGIFKETSLYPDVEKNCMSTSFSHIFQGGYASGYYSYKWAEVLDADAFEYFKEQGIFNKEISTKFKDHILSKGGTENPMELYKRFRGKEPEPEALLRRAGLLN